MSSKRRSSLGKLCLYALSGALIFALKMAMAPLPNIEPVTLLLLICGMCFPWQGLWCAIVYVVLELLFWGIGPWSISYLYLWPLIFSIGHLLRSIHSTLFWAFTAALCGFGFGAACAPVFLAMGGWSAMLAWWQAGVLFDLLHGCGNFVLMLLLYRPLRALFSRLCARYGI